MSSKVWIDGKLLDKNDARISVFDHGLLFGDGVWEGMRIFGGRVFKLREHLDRLRASAAAVGLALPLSADELASAVETTVKANARTEGYVRLTVTRGAGTLGLDPRKCDPSFIIVAEDVVPYPREVYDAGLDVVLSEVRLPDPRSVPPGVRTLNSLPHVLAKLGALRAGCLEALMMDSDDWIVGGSETDLALVRDGELWFAPGGVIHNAIADLARSVGPTSTGSRIHRDLVDQAYEVFLTSAEAEVIAVRSVDGRPVGSGREGPVTRKLRELYREATRRPG
jgi:branched-chain amino acid aminotransferase